MTSQMYIEKNELNCEIVPHCNMWMEIFFLSHNDGIEEEEEEEKEKEEEDKGRGREKEERERERGGEGEGAQISLIEPTRIKQICEPSNRHGEPSIFSNLFVW